VNVFLFLSKTLDFMLCPLSWALLLLAGAFAVRRRPSRALGLRAAAVGVLLVFASEPMSIALSRLVEASAATTFRPETSYDAAIVLGGGLDPEATQASGRPEHNGGVERILRGFELLREGRVQRVLISGGSLDPKPGAVIEAQVLARQLVDWGIAPERVLAETKSRSTRENAVESARIVREQGWSSLLLVTSAAHLQRALGCFHAVGLRPDAQPVDYRRRELMWTVAGLLPRARNLEVSTDMLRELFGRAVYRLLGYSTP
jgi:uncharacterized SAM-binding protein YcdF (DUF218 family)